MKKILLLCMPGVETMEFSPFIDIFGWNELLGSRDIHLVFSSPIKEIKSSWNLPIECEITWEKIRMEEYSALILPGGFGRFGYFQEIQNPQLHLLIQQAIEHKLYILGICTGSILLAATKLFQNQKMTTYLQEKGRYWKQLKAYGVTGCEISICKDEKLWTSSAPATAIPLAFDLLEALTNTENRKYIEQLMGFYEKNNYFK